ncbi:MAG TPA: hypothetical protein VND66_02960 [Acidobacteriaceae bacterium]|nr:hypothetical protein [Terriglobia bacterium]HVC89561.1 hypothetical protein [Acidobacteriaceae bacterium]
MLRQLTNGRNSIRRYNDDIHPRALQAFNFAQRDCPCADDQAPPPVES